MIIGVLSNVCEKAMLQFGPGGGGWAGLLGFENGVYWLEFGWEQTSEKAYLRNGTKFSRVDHIPHPDVFAFPPFSFPS